jgi:NADPH:quinone reductase-like Zn-dependent oxidoreductase
MFTRSLYQTDDKIQQHHLLTKVAALVDEGRIRTTMTQDFGLLTVDNLRRAHALLESQQSRGKIVLQVSA